MAFLVWDQNQGIRNDGPARKRAGIATVLFHPDFNRRLRNCTESADPSLFGEGARGLGSPSFRGPYRRWGLSPRPENRPPRIERPLTTMTKWRGVGKRLCHREPPSTYAVTAMLRGKATQVPLKSHAEKLTICRRSRI